MSDATMTLNELLTRAENMDRRDQAAGAVDTIEDDDAVNDLLGSKENETKIKVKRIIPKLTDEMLRRESGFQSLIKATRALKKSSKPGKTFENLLQTIQLWGHEVFPNSNLKDFTTNAKKMCGKRDMRNFRDSLIDRERRIKMGLLVDDSVIPVEPVEAAVAEEDDIALFNFAIPQLPTSSSINPVPIVAAQPEVQLPVGMTLSVEKLNLIEANRLKAMALLAKRKAEREELRRAEEEREFQQMADDAGSHYFDSANVAI